MRIGFAQKALIILRGMHSSLFCRLLATSAAIVMYGAAPAFAHEPDATEIALGSLVDAELAFARMSLEQGIRAAFLANFAVDGILFEPAPIRWRDAWPQHPAPADPKAVRLE